MNINKPTLTFAQEAYKHAKTGKSFSEWLWSPLGRLAQEEYHKACPIPAEEPYVTKDSNPPSKVKVDPVTPEEPRLRVSKFSLPEDYDGPNICTMNFSSKQAFDEFFGQKDGFWQVLSSEDKHWTYRMPILNKENQYILCSGASILGKTYKIEVVEPTSPLPDTISPDLPTIRVSSISLSPDYNGPEIRVIPFTCEATRQRFFNQEGTWGATSSDVNSEFKFPLLDNNNQYIPVDEPYPECENRFYIELEDEHTGRVYTIGYTLLDQCPEEGQACIVTDSQEEVNELMNGEIHEVGLELITKIEEDKGYPYVDGDNLAWKYAIPVTETIEKNWLQRIVKVRARQ